MSTILHTNVVKREKSSSFHYFFKRTAYAKVEEENIVFKFVLLYYYMQFYMISNIWHWSYKSRAFHVSNKIDHISVFW